MILYTKQTLTLLFFLIGSQGIYAQDIPHAEMPSLDILTGDAAWACEVHLCLANPNGAKAVSECHPPINRLIRELAKGHAFPHCKQAGDGNYIVPNHERFDPCDQIAKGYTEAPYGYVAKKGRGYEFNYNGQPWEDEHHVYYHDKACVKNYLYTRWIRRGWDEDDDPVRVYEDVIWQKPKYPQAFDVYIDGKLWQRSRIQ